ncbi:MAG: hypothetical protein Q6363_007815 [Candidatus Njordarchaeota archaeon]
MSRIRIFFFVLLVGGLFLDFSPMFHKMSISERVPSETQTDAFIFRMGRLSNGSYVAYLVTYGPVVPHGGLRYSTSQPEKLYGIDAYAWKRVSFSDTTQYYWNFTYYNASSVSYVLGTGCSGTIYNNSHCVFLFSDGSFSAGQTRIQIRFDSATVYFTVLWQTPSLSGGSRTIYYTVLIEGSNSAAWKEYIAASNTEVPDSDNETNENMSDNTTVESNITTDIGIVYTTTYIDKITTAINGTTTVITSEIVRVVTETPLIASALVKSDEPEEIKVNYVGVGLAIIGALGLFLTKKTILEY